MELKLKQDIYEYGYHQQGNYKGVGWSMKRHPENKHWCGYVHFKGEINDTLQELIMDMHDLVELTKFLTKDGHAKLNIGVYNPEHGMVHETWELIVEKGIVEHIIRNQTNFYLKNTPDPGLTFDSENGHSIRIYPESEYPETEPNTFDEKLYHFLHYKEHYITPVRISGTVMDADGIVSFTWP